MSTPSSTHQQNILATAISRHIWETKYRYLDDEGNGDQSIEDTWMRVAHALAGVEIQDSATWQQRFFDILRDFRFLPGGRILAGAGTGKQVTLFNCFVMGTIEDSLDGIFDALKQGALTMQQGGGIGYDFSSLRPAGLPAHHVGGIASGPVSFMRIWDSMCATLLSTGARRGAMMACLRCDHPDIETFVDAKRDARELRHFNLSILVTDDFMRAVHEDDDWPLVFPLAAGEFTGDTVVMRQWSGQRQEVACRVLKTIKARSLWDRIMRATYDYAEPGVLFIDIINRRNNLGYCEVISATNPCGEIPLPPYGACDLGSINLGQFIKQPFSKNAHLDNEALIETVRIATRLLDNVIDLSLFPLPAQQTRAQQTRRIGLGITGLADALIMLGHRYGDPQSLKQAGNIMRDVCHNAYRSSIDLAKEKGAFPLLDKTKYLKQPFIQSLPEDIRQGIAQHGIRNSHLTAIAPAGTISLLANNISSGVEPVFSFQHHRKILEANGEYRSYSLEDAAWRLWQAQQREAPLPEHFVDITTLSPEDHINMEAALLPYVDNAISKTINVPRDYPFEKFLSLYQIAYDKKLKGCTTFRENPVTGAILTTNANPETASHCCNIEREAD
ncbi:MAG: adenosylcobalamin-dependent ribonucleoside-diphosphate reductase [Gammaproteobacteria bacterium]|nr:adenosylcobalamin-dependent ribonucleoside-diphosphate reductase [Gammaproteobacteria bacterium]